MGSDASAVLKRVQDEGVEFVRFWFTDIFGQLKSFAVGKDELEDAFADGMGFDGSSITGFNRIEESDMIAMPDPFSPNSGLGMKVACQPYLSAISLTVMR